MAEGRLQPPFHSVKFDFRPRVFDEAEEVVAVGTPVRSVLPQMPMRAMPVEVEPCEQERDIKWWPVRNAAYGNVLSTDIMARPQPFILPALGTHGELDARTQRSILHFNYILCRIYSEKLLPVLYNCTGTMNSIHGRTGPIYVNPKQYHCILRRRIQRAKLLRSNHGILTRKKYLHESRHKHATKRLRNAHGRFISKVKTEEGVTDISTSSEPSVSTSSA